MTSKEIRKVPLKKDEYFSNIAPYNQPPRWEKRTKIGGYMVTQRQYDEAIKKRK